MFLVLDVVVVHMLTGLISKIFCFTGRRFLSCYASFLLPRSFFDSLLLFLCLFFFFKVLFFFFIAS